MTATAMVDGRLVAFDGQVWRYVDTASVVEDFNNDGTPCQGCGRTYFFDLIVANDLWETVKPIGKPRGCGMLCPQCITTRIEEYFGTCVFHLNKPVGY